MNNEIELKLNPQHSDLKQLVAFLDQSAEAKPQLELSNSYFDTPDLALSQARAALRIRSEVKEGVQRFEQTLKTRGTSVGGIHQRQEWDWPLEQVQLDTDLLAEDSVKQALPKSISLANIDCLFSTDFKRNVWLYRQGEALVEVVLDQGFVKTSKNDKEIQQPLLELELELKQGELVDMFALAEQLTAKFPMAMSDISKAERGYRLAGVQEASHLNKYRVAKQATSNEAFATLFAAEFSQLQRLIEASLTTGHSANISLPDSAHKSAQSIRQLYFQLHQLKYLIKMFGATVKRKQTTELRKLINQAQELVEPIMPWASLYIVSDWPAQCEKKLTKHLTAALEQARRSLIWGQLTLYAGQWLLSLELAASDKSNLAALLGKSWKQLWQEKSYHLIQGNWSQWQDQYESLIHLRQLIQYSLNHEQYRNQLDSGALTVTEKLLLEVEIGLMRYLNQPEQLFDIIDQSAWRQWLAEFACEQTELCQQQLTQLQQLKK